MQFLTTTKMADVIHHNYLLLSVLNRFDIRLGFGDKTIEEVCNKQNVNVNFFLEIINSFHDQDYFPRSQLQAFPIKLIIDYIKKSHSYYLDFKMPQIERMIHALTEDATASKKQLELIEKFFSEYKEELIAHIQDEENRVYPYVLAIDNAFQSDCIEPSHVQMVTENSINFFADAHNNMEDKLYDLKNIIIKYIPPATDYTLTNSLLIELFRLERDLNDHARIEDKILVPKVQQVENEILKIKK